MMHTHGFARGLIAVAVVGALAAPVQAQAPADAHVGHVATQFRGTPAGQGLLPTAVAEAEVAATHAGYAANDPTNLGSIQNHMAHVIHALDPSVVESGPGAGYGVKAAATGAARHITMAGDSDGASEAVSRHAPHVAAGANNAAAWVDEAVGLAQEIEGVSDAETAIELVHELIDKIAEIQSGVEGQGQEGWGLAQASQHLGFITGS